MSVMTEAPEHTKISVSGASVIYAGNEPKSVLARDLGDCRDNLRNSRSVFLIVEVLVTAILTNYLSLYQIFLL